MRKVSTLLKLIAPRIVALAVGVVLAAGLAEAAARTLRPQRTGPPQLAYDPRVGLLPIPNLHGRITLPGVYQYVFTHDAEGRRITRPVTRHPVGPGILLLGDSFTYGVGVNDDQTFAFRLEALLTDIGKPVRVFNAGNPGKGTDYALRYVETIGATLAPTVTLLCFVPNDFSDNERNRLYRVADDGTLSVRPSIGQVYARRARFTRSGTYQWVMTWSHLANMFRYAATPYQGNDFYPDSRAGFATQRRAIFVTRVYLQHLAQAAAGSIFGIVYFPLADEVEDYRKSGQLSRDERTLRSLLPRGVEFSSLTPVLAASSEPLSALYYDEDRRGRPSGHWTPLANDIVAHHLARFLEGQLLPAGH